MVLTTMPGGAVGAGRAPAPPTTGEVGGQALARGETGSQALEFAMIVPLLGVLLGLLAQTGLLLADVLVAHGIAREAGRTAAVDGDEHARDVVEDLAGDRDVRLEFEDHDGLVEARVELATRAFASVGVQLWLPARAAFRREAPVGLFGDDG
ncbi:MAG TPA: TadE/TadG family type IV pilus assembly protein [Euzebyales bacterium]|nr:TadE/TadG family type IV pilus assembly protein [Euzebyales bacterium]